MRIGISNSGCMRKLGSSMLKQWVYGAVALVFAVCVLPVGAHAECKIESVSFAQDSGSLVGTTPFFAGYRKEGSYKTLNITTNNNASCKDQKAYIAIFAKNIDTGNGINKVLDNANGQTSYPLVKTGEFGGSETYGLSVNYYTAEEGCYDNTHIDLKKYIKNSTKYTKDDFKYLSTDDKNKALYGYLFDDESYKTYYSAPTSSLSSNYGGGATQIHDYHITPHILWTAKQLIYTKFGGAVDCAYYARAKIGTPIDIGSKYDSLGKPIATFDSALDSTVGTKINYLGYMCSPPETGISTSCDDSEEWEKRTTGAYIGGAIDTGDPCTPNGTPTPGCYELLAPIPGLAGNDNTINFLGTAGGEPFALEQFFTAAINVIVGATSVAAVLALMYYGFAMMNARSAGNMRNLSKYKARLWSVFWGLGIILGSYVILNTINPELLKIAPGLTEVTFDGDVDGVVSKYADTSAYFKSVNFHCPGLGGLNEIPKIALSAEGKVTYKLAQKGTPGPNGTVYSDCSGFAAKLYQCAGVPFPASSAFTGHIFKGAEVITSSASITATSVNGKPLRPGDMLGWTAGGGERQGHVFTYIGNGRMVDSHGPADKIGKAYGNWPVDGRYAKRIKAIKRAP
jgi:hypothetical protein